MAKLFSKNELPSYVSTRDSRERLDLITENVHVGARHLRADRIIYYKGDTSNWQNVLDQLELVRMYRKTESKILGLGVH